MTFQQTIVLPLGRVLYPYDCMEKFEKLNEEKLKICKRKTDLWKNLKNLEKEETWISKVDFVHDWQPRITSAIVDNHDNVRF